MFGRPACVIRARPADFPNAQAGRQSLRFSGRLRGKPLKPGGYRATIVAVDSAGQASDPRRVSFRVVHG